MKHLRLILLLLAVCFTQISFSQDLSKKWDEEKFMSAIEQVLAEADTEEEAEKEISRLLKGDGYYITEQDKANIANAIREMQEEACQMGCKTCCWQECISPRRHVCSQLLRLGI